MNATFRRFANNLVHSLQKILTLQFCISLRSSNFKKCVSLLVIACFLFNIAGVSALAYDDNEYKKIKKENESISVLNANARMHSVAASMKPLKVGANNTVTRDGKVIGTIDPKTGEISTMQQGEDGGQTSLKPDKLLTEQYRKQQDKSKESARNDTRKTDDGRMTTGEKRESGEKSQNGYQFQKTVQTPQSLSSGIEDNNKNKKDVKVSQNQNTIVSRNSQVQELNKNTKLETQMVNGKKLDTSEVAVVNMTKVQQVAAGAGIKLIAKKVMAKDIEKAMQQGTMIAHLKNKAGGSDVFVSIGKDGTMKYADQDGNVVVTSLSDFKQKGSRKYEWTGKVLQQASAAKETETLPSSIKNDTKGTFFQEILTNGDNAQAVQAAVKKAQTTKTARTATAANTGQKVQTEETAAKTTTAGTAATTETAATSESDSQKAISSVTQWLDKYSKADAATQATMAAEMSTTLGISKDQIAKLSTETAQKISSYLTAQGSNVINCAVESLSNLFATAGKTLDKAATAVSAIMTDVLSGNLDTSSEQMRLSMFAIQKTAEQNGMTLTGYSTNMSGLQQAVSGNKGAIAQLNTANGLGHFVTVTGIKDGNVTYKDADGQSKTVSSSEFSSQWSGNVLSQNKIEGASVLNEKKLQSIKGAAGSETEAADAAVTAAGSKVSAADSKLTAANSKVAAADSKVQAASTKVQTADAKVQAANSKVQTADAKVQTANAKVQTANTKVQTANAKVQTANAKVQTANAKLQTANAKVQTANAKVQTANAKVQTANAKLQTANAKVQTANAKLQTANAKVQTANAKLQAANTKLQTANTKVQTANAKVQAANTKLQAANTKLQAANTKVTNATNKVNTANAANQAAQTALKAAQAKTQAAQTKYNQALTTQQQKTQAATAAAQKVQQAQTKVASAQQAVQSAQQKVSSAQSNLASKTQALASAVANVASARSSLASAQSAVASAQSAVSSARARLASAKTPEEKAAAQAALNAALARLAAAKAAEEAARRALEAAIAAQKRAEEEKRRAEQELQQAQQELQQKQQELTQAQQELTQAQAEKTKADAEKLAADTAVTQAKNELTTAQNEENTAKQNADKTAKDLQQAQQELQQAQQEQQQAQKEQQQAQQEQQQAQQELQQAQQEQQQAQQEQQQAQQEQQQAQQEQQQAQQELQQAQQEQQQAQQELQTAQQEQQQAQQELQTAQQEQQQAQQELQQAQQEQQTAQQELQQAQQEQQQAQQELQQAQQEKQQAEQEKQQAEQEKQQAEQEKQQAETEKQAATTEKQQAEQEKQQAEAEKKTAEDNARKAQEEAAKKLVEDAKAGTGTEAGTNSKTGIQNNSDWLKTQYKEIFGRDVDEGAVKTYGSILDNAGSDAQRLEMAKNAIVNTLKSSDEYKARNSQSLATAKTSDAAKLSLNELSSAMSDAKTIGDTTLYNTLSTEKARRDAIYQAAQKDNANDEAKQQKAALDAAENTKSSEQLSKYGLPEATQEALNDYNRKAVAAYNQLANDNIHPDVSAEQLKKDQEASDRAAAEYSELKYQFDSKEAAAKGMSLSEYQKYQESMEWSPTKESRAAQNLSGKSPMAEYSARTTAAATSQTTKEKELTGSEKLAQLKASSNPTGEVKIIRTNADNTTTVITANKYGNVSTASVEPAKTDSTKKTNLSAQQQKKWDIAASANAPKAENTSEPSSQKPQTTNVSFPGLNVVKAPVDTSKITSPTTQKKNTETEQNGNFWDKAKQTLSNIKDEVVKKVTGSGTASATAVTPVKNSTDNTSRTNVSVKDNKTETQSSSRNTVKSAEKSGNSFIDTLKTSAGKVGSQLKKIIPSATAAVGQINNQLGIYQAETVSTDTKVGEKAGVGKDSVMSNKDIKTEKINLPKFLGGATIASKVSVVDKSTGKQSTDWNLGSNNVYSLKSTDGTRDITLARTKDGNGGTNIDIKVDAKPITTYTVTKTQPVDIGAAIAGKGSISGVQIKGEKTTPDTTEILNLHYGSGATSPTSVNGYIGTKPAADGSRTGKIYNINQDKNGKGTANEYNGTMKGGTSFNPTGMHVDSGKEVAVEKGKISDETKVSGDINGIAWNDKNQITGYTAGNYRQEYVISSDPTRKAGTTDILNGRVNIQYDSEGNKAREAYTAVNKITEDSKTGKVTADVTLGTDKKPYTLDYSAEKNVNLNENGLRIDMDGAYTTKVKVNGDVIDNIAAQHFPLADDTKTSTNVKDAVFVQSKDSLGRVTYSQGDTGNYTTTIINGDKAGVVLASGRNISTTGASYNADNVNPSHTTRVSEKYSYMANKPQSDASAKALYMGLEGMSASEADRAVQTSKTGTMLLMDAGYEKKTETESDMKYDGDKLTASTHYEKIQQNALNYDQDNKKVSIGNIVGMTESREERSNYRETTDARTGETTSSYDFSNSNTIDYTNPDGPAYTVIASGSRSATLDETGQTKSMVTRNGDSQTWRLNEANVKIDKATATPVLSVDGRSYSTMGQKIEALTDNRPAQGTSGVKPGSLYKDAGPVDHTLSSSEVKRDFTYDKYGRETGYKFEQKSVSGETVAHGAVPAQEAGIETIVEGYVKDSYSLTDQVMALAPDANDNTKLTRADGLQQVQTSQQVITRQTVNGQDVTPAKTDPTTQKIGYDNGLQYQQSASIDAVDNIQSNSLSIKQSQSRFETAVLEQQERNTAMAVGAAAAVVTAGVTIATGGAGITLVPVLTGVILGGLSGYSAYSGTADGLAALRNGDTRGAAVNFALAGISFLPVLGTVGKVLGTVKGAAEVAEGANVVKSAGVLGKLGKAGTSLLGEERAVAIGTKAKGVAAAFGTPVSYAGSKIAGVVDWTAESVISPIGGKAAALFSNAGKMTSAIPGAKSVAAGINAGKAAVGTVVDAAGSTYKAGAVEVKDVLTSGMSDKTLKAVNSATNVLKDTLTAGTVNMVADTAIQMGENYFSDKPIFSDVSAGSMLDSFVSGGLLGFRVSYGTRAIGNSIKGYRAAAALNSAGVKGETLAEAGASAVKTEKAFGLKAAGKAWTGKAADAFVEAAEGGSLITVKPIVGFAASGPAFTAIDVALNTTLNGGELSWAGSDEPKYVKNEQTGVYELANGDGKVDASSFLWKNNSVYVREKDANGNYVKDENGQYKYRLADTLGKKLVTEPFQFAKMGIWMTPTMGILQAPAQFYKAGIGEKLAGSRLGSTIDVLSSEHSLSNVMRTGHTLLSRDASETAAGYIGKNLARAEGRGGIGTGIARSLDSAGFVSTTLAATQNVAMVLGASQQTAADISFASLFFLPGAARAPQDYAIKDHVSESEATQLLAAKDSDGARVKDVLKGDSIKLPLDIQYAKTYEAKERLLSELTDGRSVNYGLDATEIGEKLSENKGEARIVTGNNGKKYLVADNLQSQGNHDGFNIKGNFEVTVAGKEGKSVASQQLHVTVPESGQGAGKVSLKYENGKYTETVNGMEMQLAGEEVSLRVRTTGESGTGAGDKEYTVKNAKLNVEDDKMYLVRSDGESADNNNVLFGKVLIAEKDKAGNWQQKAVKADDAGIKNDVSSKAIIAKGEELLKEELLKNEATGNSLREKLKNNASKEAKVAAGLIKEYSLKEYPWMTEKTAQHFAREAIANKNKEAVIDTYVKEAGENLTLKPNVSIKKAIVSKADEIYAEIQKDPELNGVMSKFQVQTAVGDTIMQAQYDRMLKLNTEIAGKKRSPEIVDRMSEVLGLDKAVGNRKFSTDGDGPTVAEAVFDNIVKMNEAKNISGFEKGVTLRSGQMDTIREAMNSISDKKTKIFIENATAGGKTLANIAIAKIRSDLGLKTDIVLPNEVLKDQTVAGGYKDILEKVGAETSYTDLDKSIEKWQKGGAEGLSDQALVNVFEKTSVLVYTEKSFFLFQQAAQKGSLEVKKAFLDRQKDTLLLLDEAHLYMKNNMDLIIAGDKKSIDSRYLELAEKTVQDLKKNGLLKEVDGRYEVNDAELKTAAEAATVAGEHVAFTQEYRDALKKEGVNVSVAERLVSGVKSIQENRAVLVKAGIRPISSVTGATEYSREFQDAIFIYGAGKGAGVKEARMADVVRQSVTTSAEALFSIFKRYDSIMAMSGTPPESPVLSQWGFNLKNVGFNGGVERQYSIVDSGTAADEMAAIAMSKLKDHPEKTVVIQTDLDKKAVKELLNDVVKGVGKEKVEEFSEDNMEYLRKGGYKGKIVIANRIAGLGVDFETNLVMITDARYSESIIGQSKGRPSRHQEYGEFIVVAEKGWVDAEFERYSKLDWDSVTAVTGEKQSTAEAWQEAVKKKGELSAEKKLELVQKYMDAKSENQVYTGTISQVLRDKVVEQIESLPKGDELKNAFMESYFEKKIDVDAESEIQKKAGEQAGQGFSGREQMLNELTSTRNALIRTLEQMAPKDKAIEKILSEVEELDITGRNSGARSLSEAQTLQEVVDVGYRYADNLVPVEMLTGKSAAKSAAVEYAGTRDTAEVKVTSLPEAVQNIMPANYTSNGILTDEGKLFAYTYNMVTSLRNASLSGSSAQTNGTALTSEQTGSAAGNYDYKQKQVSLDMTPSAREIVSAMNSYNWKQAALGLAVSKIQTAQKGGNATLTAFGEQLVKASDQMSGYLDAQRDLVVLKSGKLAAKEKALAKKDTGQQGTVKTEPRLSAVDTLTMLPAVLNMKLQERKFNNAVNAAFQTAMKDNDIADKTGLIDALQTARGGATVYQSSSLSSKILSAKDLEKVQNLNNGDLLNNKDAQPDWSAVSFNDYIKAVKNNDLPGMVTKAFAGTTGRYEDIVKAELKALPMAGLAAAGVAGAATLGFTASPLIGILTIASPLIISALQPALSQLANTGDTISGKALKVMAGAGSPFTAWNAVIDKVADNTIAATGSDTYKIARALQKARAETVTEGTSEIAKDMFGVEEGKSGIPGQLHQMAQTMAIQEVQDAGIPISKVLKAAEETRGDAAMALEVAGLAFTNVKPDTVINRYNTLQNRYAAKLPGFAEKLTVTQIAENDLGFDGQPARILDVMETAAESSAGGKVTVDWYASDLKKVDGKTEGTLSLTNGQSVAVKQYDNFITLGNTVYDLAGKKLVQLNNTANETRPTSVAERKARTAGKTLQAAADAVRQGLSSGIGLANVLQTNGYVPAGTGAHADVSINTDRGVAVKVLEDGQESAASVKATALQKVLGDQIATFNVANVKPAGNSNSKTLIFQVAGDTLKTTLTKASEKGTIATEGVKAVEAAVTHINAVSAKGYAYVETKGDILDNIGTTKQDVNKAVSFDFLNLTKAVTPAEAKKQSLGLLTKAIDTMTGVDASDKALLRTPITAELAKIDSESSSIVQKALSPVTEAVKKAVSAAAVKVESSAENSLNGMAGRALNRESVFSVTKPGETNAMLALALRVAQSPEALYNKLGIDFAAQIDGKNIEERHALVNEYADGQLKAIKAQVKDEKVQDKRISFVKTVRDILLNEKALTEYTALTKTLNEKGSLDVNQGALEKLGSILSEEDKVLKYRIADSEIMKWKKGQIAEAKKETGKASEEDKIDVSGLQRELDAVGKYRKDSSGLAKGVIDSIWKIVTGTKKTTSEIAMEKEIKDLFGKNGDFGSGIIEKDSELNILNPLSSKGFTQSA